MPCYPAMLYRCDICGRESLGEPITKDKQPNRTYYTDVPQDWQIFKRAIIIMEDSDSQVICDDCFKVMDELRNGKKAGNVRE